MTKFYFTTVSSFKSTPAHEVGGVLAACAGEQITLMCRNDSLNSGATRWIFSQPVDCSETIDHNPLISTDPCGPFSFQGVSVLVPDAALYSTAVATANTSMTGTVVQCRNSAGILSASIGNVTLCVYGEL